MSSGMVTSCFAVLNMAGMVSRGRVAARKPVQAAPREMLRKSLVAAGRIRRSSSSAI